MPRRRKLVKTAAASVKVKATFAKVKGPKHFSGNPALESVSDAKAWVNQYARKPGAVCPCCDQLVKHYPRSIHSSMALTLILVARRSKGFVHVARLLASLDLKPELMAAIAGGGDFSKLRFWNLIEAQPGDRADGSNRNGFWRVTPLGVDFVNGRVKVPRTVWLFDNQAIGFEDVSDVIGIRDCLGDRFDYRKLMRS
jgi:hypothetical protein